MIEVIQNDKSPNKEYIFTVNPDVDMTKIKISMQIDSNTTIATQKHNCKTAMLEVMGEVKVWRNEDGEPKNGDYFIYLSEFPEKLKKLVAGEIPVIYDKKETTELPWTLDHRLYISENNWFECFIFQNDNDTLPSAFKADIEG